MLVRFTIELLRKLNCFDEVPPPSALLINPDEAPPPSALLMNPNRVRVRRQPLYEDLLPGLPNSLVLECILPRIPWYARPLLDATSRAWSNALDDLSASDRYHARTFYDSKDRDSELYNVESNLVKVQLVEGRRYAISLYDSKQELWRKLPPLPCEKALRACSQDPIRLPPKPSHPHFDSLPPIPVVAGFMYREEIKNPIHVDYVRGKVIAAHMYDVDISMCGACTWTLDVEGGMWKWEERHSHKERYLDNPLNTNMVVIAGKLYILRGGSFECHKPVVYDVASDEWGQPPDFSEYRYFYGVKTIPDPDTGKSMKQLFAFGPGWITKTLDHLTETWKDYGRQEGP